MANVCNETKYVYFRLNGGVIVVAYKLVDDKSGDKMRLVYDFASCSPYDKFERRLGRNKALGRLTSRINKMPVVYPDLEFTDDRTQGQYKMAVRAIETDLFAGDGIVHLPQWARRPMVTETSEFTRELTSLIDKFKSKLTRKELNASHSILEYKTMGLL